MGDFKDNSLQFFSWHRYFNTDLKHFFKKYQMFGRGFVLSLFEQIAFSKNAFWIKFGSVEQQDFCDDFNIRADKFKDMFQMLIEQNFFDKEKYEKYQILTNYELQKAFLQTKTKSKVTKIEHTEYMLECFIQKITNVTLSESGKVDNISEVEEFKEHTKLNETQNVDNSKDLSKLVNNISLNNKNILNNSAHACAQVQKSVDINSKMVTSIIDAQNHIQSFKEEDRVKYNILKEKLTSDINFICLDDSKLPAPMLALPDDYKVATYNVLFGLIDLVNVKNEQYTIKVGSEPEHLKKRDILQLIYELEPADMYALVDTVVKRQDIYKLPFFLLGAMVRISKQKEQRKLYKEKILNKWNH